MSENIIKRLESLEKKGIEPSRNDIHKLQEEISEMKLFLTKVLEYQPRKIKHVRK